MNQIGGEMLDTEWVTAVAATPQKHVPKPEDDDDYRDLVPTGPTQPDPEVIPAPDIIDQLPTKRLPSRTDGQHWYVAAHGGAGATTLAAMDENGGDAGNVWPINPDGQNVIVVARETATGLKAAQTLARQWGSGVLPAVNLLALITIPSQPGRSPHSIATAMKRTAGMYPRHYRANWNPQLLTVESHQSEPTKADRKIIRLVTKLSAKETR